MRSQIIKTPMTRGTHGPKIAPVAVLGPLVYVRSLQSPAAGVQQDFHQGQLIGTEVGREPQRLLSTDES